MRGQRSLSDGERSDLRSRRTQIDGATASQRALLIARALGAASALVADGVPVWSVARALGITPAELSAWSGMGKVLPRTQPGTLWPPWRSAPSFAPTEPADTAEGRSTTGPAWPAPEWPAPRIRPAPDHPRDSPDLVEPPVRYRTEVLALSGPFTQNQRPDRILAAVRRAFSPRGSFPVEHAGVTVAELAHLVGTNQPRVLHLIAHVDDDGVWLVDRGDEWPASWESVIGELARVRTPEVIVLSCCRSDDAAAAVAERFGVWALGCAGVVPTESERLFMETFYERWDVRGLQVDGVQDAFDDSMAHERTRHGGAPAWCHCLFRPGNRP